MSNQEENIKTQTSVEQEVPGLICFLLLNQGYSVKPLKPSTDGIEIILINPENLIDIATFVKMHKETQFNLLFSVSGTDYPEYFEVIYHLYSTNFNNKIILKSYLNKNNPEIDSLTGLYSAADWHERETFDLFGIQFKNHPNLERILLPKDWKGHPLRKDYVLDDERLTWNER